MSDFLIEEVVRVKATFKNENDVIADPQGVEFRYTPPDGAEIHYVYSSSPASTIKKLKVGVYYVDLDLHQHETWEWGFYGTGIGKAAAEGTFTVQKSQFIT